MTKVSSLTLVDPRVKFLKDKVKLELSRYPKYTKDVDKDLSKLVHDLIIAIVPIEFEKVAVEITPNATLKFKLLIDEEKLLIISKPLKDNELNADQVIFSIFFNRELVVSDCKNVHELVKGFNNFLALPSIS
ncbi:hypothetical protein DYU11_04075 [Fibrisoma montanum]|uniref:Uncharacterized protein n=2 Tax=Fibrisoma montanum TaxID=2305895 RepID=A0A418MJH9_9BACT|nr:hypothetical protein DYU11_04075 [Fibrisoma montanum]